MKRAFLPLAAACVLFATACGDATTEKTSHGTTQPDADETQQTSNDANTGMADTMSTNATLPGSASPSTGNAAPAAPGGTGD